MNFFRVPKSDIAFHKGEIVYLHDGKDVSSGAFEKNQKAELKILLPRLAGVVSVFVRIYDQALTDAQAAECTLLRSDLLFDTFIADVSHLPVGLYFFDLRIITVSGELGGYKGKRREILLSDSVGDRFQLSMVDFRYNSPSKYFGGTIYHVFVDRFAKSGKTPCRSDAIMLEDWDNGVPEYPEYPGAHLENNTFFGGDLYGVIDKLDYIRSLGVNLIYLSPIFEAYSNHKYDTGNYMKVDDMFGGDEALRQLISEAKSRGIGIILDGVFNHTGSDSIYFNKNGRYDSIGAYQSKESEYYSWYDFKSYPDDYTCWWDIKILPRINPDVSKCGDYIAGKGGVVDKYAKMGIAGMRLDVADELSDAFIERIKHRLSSCDPHSLLYGEVWEDASNKIAYDKRKRYYLGTELDGVMNYPLRTGIISYLRDHDTSALEYALDEVTFNAPVRIRNMQMNLLGTHDTERIITILAGPRADGKTNAELSQLYLDSDERARGLKLVRLAYAILATVPGIPTVYYGDEVGLEGYKDPFNRRPYPWNNADEGLRCFYKKIGEIRSTESVYKDGNFAVEYMSENLMILSRYNNESYLYTIINNSENDMIIKLSHNADQRICEKRGRDLALKPLACEIVSSDKKIDFKIV